MMRDLQTAYGLDAVTVVADAGICSDSNKRALQAARLDYILGVRFSDIPHPVAQWQDSHPGEDYQDGQTWAHHNRGNCGPGGEPVAVTWCQYSWDRARRSIKGIDQQTAKTSASRSRQDGGETQTGMWIYKPHSKQVHYALAAKNRALARIKGYETSRVDLATEEVIGSYRRLFTIEKALADGKIRYTGPPDVPSQD